MAAGVVGDHRVRHAVMAEFPGGQRSALIARPGLVDPDVNREAAIVRQIDRRRRRSPVDRRQPAGVAMRQDVDGFAGLLGRGDRLDQRQTMPADFPVDRHILFGDLTGALIGGLARAEGGSGRKRPPHLVERPFQIDRGRPRRDQHLYRPDRAPHRRYRRASPAPRHRRRWRRSAARRAPAWSGSPRRRHRRWSIARRRIHAAAAAGRSRRPTSRRARARCCGNGGHRPHALRLRVARPREFSRPQHPSRHRVELFQQRGIARLRRRDQRGVERAVRTDRAWLVLARKIPGQTRNQPLAFSAFEFSTRMMSCTVTAS